jgi:2-dehydro-3-deoxyphosphogluconate aldolase/(4S)-4-hydroxy-2-oxoglutarate aldolase
MNTIRPLLRLAPVIPVLRIEDPAFARPIAEALVAAGLCLIEVTLRTPAALDVIREMGAAAGAVVGAGTVLNLDQLDDAIEAGAKFIVSPGLTEQMARGAQNRGVRLLPGVATASDIMRGLDLGLDTFKFFPAEAAGGVDALRSLMAPFPGARFCPTGGITQSSAPRWLALGAVPCVGGSWIVPDGQPDLKRISASATAASTLGRLL